MSESITITVLDEDTAEVEVRLPAKYEVCPRCQGRGTHDHPAFSNGITSDEWNSPDWDDDSREAYVRGAYDVACTQCQGERVVLVADEASFTPEQQAAWQEHQKVAREIAEDYASERHLRFMESGGHHG